MNFQVVKAQPKVCPRFLHCAKLRLDAGPVAQRLEQQTHNLLVVGSNPTGPTNCNYAGQASCW
jgi:hypothetical protein